MDLDVDYATALLAAVLLGVGFVLQQYAAGQEPESRFLRLRILTDLLRKPRWLLGIACMIAGYLLVAWSIDHLPLTLVEPLLTTYLVWALILAVPISRQPVKVAEVTGALILLGGVTLISLTRPTWRGCGHWARRAGSWSPPGAWVTRSTAPAGGSSRSARSPSVRRWPT